MKLNRLRVVGKSAELSERVVAPNWAALVNLRLDLENRQRTSPMWRTDLCGAGPRNACFDAA
jgi:hypothetical protein